MSGPYYQQGPPYGGSPAQQYQPYQTPPPGAPYSRPPPQQPQQPSPYPASPQGGYARPPPPPPGQPYGSSGSPYPGQQPPYQQPGYPAQPHGQPHGLPPGPPSYVQMSPVMFSFVRCCAIVSQHFFDFRVDKTDTDALIEPRRLPTSAGCALPRRTSGRTSRTLPRSTRRSVWSSRRWSPPSSCARDSPAGASVPSALDRHHPGEESPKLLPTRPIGWPCPVAG